MSKIYILTFQRCLSFGAVLQAYALKNVLKSLYENVEIIDYENVCINRENYKIIPCISIKSIIKFYIIGFFSVMRKNKFDKFISKFLIKSDQRKYNSKNIKEIGNGGLFIVGSDQVWNHELTDGDRTYLLDFVTDESRKFSYAASFGYEEMFQKYKNKYLEFLDKFNEISLRESIGFDEISKYKKTYLHIDPTLLLETSEWLKLTTQINKRYILVYNVLKPNRIYDLAKTISEKTGLKIIDLTFYGLKHIVKNPKLLKYFAVSPNEFLSFIANAEYVFTTSFHGVVFSIIFKRNFYTELNCKDKYNYRINNLLNMLNLQNRAVDNSADDFSANINWDEVYEKLKIERNNSFDYLNMIIDIQNGKR